MKQIYIQPHTKVELAECEVMMAASILDSTIDSQSIIPSDDDYNGEFSVKEYSFGDDF